MKKLMLLSLAIFFISSMAAFAVVESVVKPEEYEVYSFLLELTSWELFVVADETRGGGHEKISEDFLKKEFGPKLDATLLARFIQENETPVQLENKFTGGLSVRILSAKEDAEIFSTVGSGGGWKEFHKRYPGACNYQFSRVAFNDARDEALVYESSICGPVSGLGEYFLLKKVGGKWTVIAQVNAWIV
ncbi:MAG: hypothetical protein HQL19_07960 [Candidatus Omnitrophica bacterium]|nr:hypothetical protein [Candidatus Omnitrophota bacterium]